MFLPYQPGGKENNKSQLKELRRLDSRKSHIEPPLRTLQCQTKSCKHKHLKHESKYENNMIIFFEKLKRNLISDKSHSKRDQNIDDMLIEIEVV